MRPDLAAQKPYLATVRSMMKDTEKHISWVVYRMTLRGKLSGIGAVCEQTEWDALEQIKPGYHILVRAGIANEGEAEQLARSIPVEAIGPPAESKLPRR